MSDIITRSGKSDPPAYTCIMLKVGENTIISPPFEWDTWDTVQVEYFGLIQSEVKTSQRNQYVWTINGKVTATAWEDQFIYLVESHA